MKRLTHRVEGLPHEDEGVLVANTLVGTRNAMAVYHGSGIMGSVQSRSWVNAKFSAMTSQSWRSYTCLSGSSDVQGVECEVFDARSLVTERCLFCMHGSI